MATKISVAGCSVNCVYDDRFRPILEALGVMQVKRATEVEFSEHTGEWIATHLATGLVIARGFNRNEVIAMEVRWLEENQIR